MQTIELLLSHIKARSDCSVLLPNGLPEIHEKHTLPEELRIFYENSGGVTLFSGDVSGKEIRILGPTEFIQADAELVGELNGSERSFDWYLLAVDSSNEYVVMDLADGRQGRVYDAFHETYGLVGDMSIIATSFVDFLSRCLNDVTLTDHYWLNPRSRSLGDAYDKRGSGYD